jgi:hypothetical protein
MTWPPPVENAGRSIPEDFEQRAPSRAFLDADDSRRASMISRDCRVCRAKTEIRARL